MKKLRIILLLAFVAALLSALAVGACAKWWEDNPYADVKPDAWYYDAVRVCRDNGVLNGVSSDRFGVGTPMTRAMFVTALAGASGYDAAAYADHTPFTDVPSGKWYSAPVAWAAENGITGGTGGGLFSPSKAITRQELALMLYKYHLATGGSEYAGNDVLEPFADSDSVSGWARTALSWACSQKIISGVASGDKTLLSPRSNAKREQFAQMFLKYLALDPVYEINGNDLSLYRIVYPAAGIPGESADDEESFSPGLLQRWIREATGIELPIVTDAEAPVDHEILLGHTNREDGGAVTVDRTALESPQQFRIEVQGSRLVFTATDENRHQPGADSTTFNVAGTRNAIYFFAEKVLNGEFYNDDNIVFTADPVISLPDGWVYTDAPTYETRILYMYSEGDDYQNGCGYYYTEAYCGVPHMLGNIIIGEFDDNHHVAWSTPCLTDPDNLASLKANVRVILERKPNLNCIGLIQNDSDGFCQCERCKAVYREEGSTSGALIRALNAVCEDLEEDYPNVKIMTWAYGWSAVPPEKTVPHKNIILCFNTLILCPAHAYNDPDCKKNRTGMQYLAKWGELASELYLWDHSGAFTAALTPFPDWDSILQNARYLSGAGCRGVFLNSMSSAKSDFADLRHYLFSIAYRRADMSEGEFSYRMNGYLKQCFGSGWKNLREYIDTVTELGNHKDHSFHAPISGFYDYAEVAEQADRLDDLWDKAEKAAAGNETILTRMAIAKGSWMYLRQCATWESRMKNGTEEQKELYRQRNTELYENIMTYDQRWEEQEREPHFDPEVSPEHW